MNLLTFDTSTEIMYITLSRDNNILDSRIVKSSEQAYNSAFLVSSIADIFKKNNITSQDLNVIGVNIGPGSFTGLRAAITVARIMAQQLNISAVGVPSLQIYSMLNTTKKETFCIMDARRGKAYVGIYDKGSNPMLEPCAMEYEKAFELAKSKDYYIISDERMVKKLQEKGLSYINFKETEENFGLFLQKQAIKLYENSDKENIKWHNLKPLYIQPPPISMPNK